MIAGPTSSGGDYLIYSAHRVDRKYIDIHPFGLIYHQTGPGPVGVFIDHGQWDGRTTPVPFDFAAHVVNIGTGSYFMTHPPSGLRSGPLDQLPKEHRGAFQTVTRWLRAREDDYRM